jgi:hypothetical protein
MFSNEQWMHELQIRAAAHREQLARGHEQLVATHRATLLSNEQHHRQELERRHEAHQNVLLLTAERNRIELEAQRRELEDKHLNRVRKQEQQRRALWEHVRSCPGC